MAEYTQEERDALRTAIASGVLTVEIHNRRVTYQSLKDMMALLAEMERGLSAPGTYYSYRVAAFDKGV